MGNSLTQQIVDDFLNRRILPKDPTFDCPYLPGREASNKSFMADNLHPDIYYALMNRGFRRSGNVFYQPACGDCHECVPIRIPVGKFKPTRSQQRVWRKNHDVRPTVGQPNLTQEKWRLYTRYLHQQHDDSMSDAYEDLYNFLYNSPVRTIEICYKLNETLIGISIVDHCREALSSVYMFFDPRWADRSLGTFSFLWEIDHCRQNNIPYYYLGLYVKDCNKMNYKAHFKPHQLLTQDFEWVEHD